MHSFLLRYKILVTDHAKLLFSKSIAHAHRTAIMQPKSVLDAFVREYIARFLYLSGEHLSMASVNSKVPTTLISVHFPTYELLPFVFSMLLSLEITIEIDPKRRATAANLFE